MPISSEESMERNQASLVKVKLIYGELRKDVQAKTCEDFSESINKALDKRWDMSAEGTYKGSEEKILADHYRTGILSTEGFPQVH